MATDTAFLIDTTVTWQIKSKLTQTKVSLLLNRPTVPFFFTCTLIIYKKRLRPLWRKSCAMKVTFRLINLHIFHRHCRKQTLERRPVTHCPRCYVEHLGPFIICSFFLPKVHVMWRWLPCLPTQWKDLETEINGRRMTWWELKKTVKDRKAVRELVEVRAINGGEDEVKKKNKKKMIMMMTTVMMIMKMWWWQQWSFYTYIHYRYVQKCCSVHIVDSWCQRILYHMNIGQFH